MNDFIDSGKDIKKVHSDIDKMTKYEITVTNENLKKMLNSAASMTGNDEGENININGDLKIPVYIDADGNISKMIMDMTNLVGSTDNTKYNKILFDFEFNNFNNTTVLIPSDVKTNATEPTDSE